MNSPRPTRNIQQVRSIIQNMGRSIDEARNRRLGPDMPAMAQPMVESRIPTPAPAPRVQMPAAAPSVSSQTPAVAPPIRSAQEMFAGDAPRLKARPKRPA